MAPTHSYKLPPLCKTAIVSFLIDRETIPKLWKLSSNMRKRMKMVMSYQNIEIVLKEFSENILKIKDWVKIGKRAKSVISVDLMNRRVSNYKLEIQEDVERVLSLNGKLRCYNIDFYIQAPLQFDCIERLEINSTNYGSFCDCSFKKVTQLSLNALSESQIKQILSKFKQIYSIEFVSLVSGGIVIAI